MERGTKPIVDFFGNIRVVDIPLQKIARSMKITFVPEQAIPEVVFEGFWTGRTIQQLPRIIERAYKRDKLEQRQSQAKGETNDH